MTSFLTMDTHSKNVCLIAILHTVAYSAFAIDNLIMEASRIGFENNFPLYYKLEPIAIIGSLSTMAVFAALVILGVVKKRYSMFTPFLVVTTLAVCIATVMYARGILFHDRLHYLHGEFKIINRIGLEIISLYPIYTLYLKLRFQYRKEKAFEVEHEKVPVI